MATVPLDASVNALAGPDGIARGEIGPTVYGHQWAIRRSMTTTNDTVPNQLRVYLNAESPDRLIGGSYNANQDFNEDDFVLQSLDKLKCVWTNCTPGTWCTFSVQGLVQDRRL